MSRRAEVNAELQVTGSVPSKMSVLRPAYIATQDLGNPAYTPKAPGCRGICGGRA